jgi:hypothetical protein
MQGIQAGKEERAPSLPSDLRRQLAALGGPPKTSSEKPPAGKELIDAVRERFAKNSSEEGPAIAKALGFKNTDKFYEALIEAKGVKRVAPTNASFSTKLAREDAEEFDKNFKIYKRIRGDQEAIDWNESARKGGLLGEGSFGTVLQVGDKAYKRGNLGAEEAEIMRRVGAAGLGPRLLGAEIATKNNYAYGTNIHPGRIAMSMVKGRELGDDPPDKMIGNKKAADVYWKALSGLHRMGIAHNDAHPDNILVDNKGNGKWVDLGLARSSPKAALNEAIGAFSKNASSDSMQVGNWQTARWDVTGIPRFNALRNIGSSKEVTEQMQKDYPALGRVVANRGKVYTQLRRMGFSQAEIREMADTEIRSPLSVYREGPWAKLTDAQAQSLINTLYDGI